MSRLTRWARLAAIAALGLACAAGCSQGISDKSLKFVNPDEAAGLAAGRGALLGLGGSSPGAFIDPRTETAYRAERIPGAINLSFDRARSLDAHLGDYGALIVYGTGYNDPLAAAMSKRLIESGFKNVHTLRGGLQAWKEAGNEVETGGG